MKPALLGLLLLGALACGPGETSDGSADPTGGAPRDRAFDVEALDFSGADLILISMDTLRADRLGVYGYDRGTSPSIDAFASQALVFDEMFSNSPKTASSHMSLFTSRLPTVHKVRNQSARLDLTSPILASNRLTLTQVLRREGYASAAFTGGANIVAEVGFKRGFGQNFRAANVAFEELVPQLAITYKQMAAQPAPGFLFAHSFEVHGPYLPPKPLQERFVRAPSERLTPRVEAYTGLPRNKQWSIMNKAGLNGQPPYWEGKESWGAAEAAHLSDLYDAGVAHMDASMGKLFRRLENQGAYENAIIVLLSDHGEEFYEHGAFEHDDLHREHLHVPCLVRLPGGHLGGTRVKGMAQLIDVMPTLLELLGRDGPEDMEGISHVGALATGRVAEERPILSERVMFPDDYKAALRTRAGLAIYHAVPGRLEAFDLRADPGAQDNIYGTDERVSPLTLQLKATLISAFGRRDLLDAIDAGGTLGDALGNADAQAELSQALESLGYVGEEGLQDVEIPEALRSSPLAAWPEDG